jgi:hypothetical protein
MSNCKYETDDEESNRGGEGERERRREFGSTFHPKPFTLHQILCKYETDPNKFKILNLQFTIYNYHSPYTLYLLPIPQHINHKPLL